MKGDETESESGMQNDGQNAEQPSEKDLINENKSASSEAIFDSNIVDWDGPKDSANPRNWSNGRKLLTTSLISLSVLYSYVQKMYLGNREYKN